MTAKRTLLRLAAAAMAAVLAAPVLAAETPLVGAAASLRAVLTEIADRFAEDGGGEIRISFASSGTLARQIARGAPFDVFLSADEQFVFDLADSGHAADRGRLYALGRLALVTRTGGAIGLDARLQGVRRALDAGTLERFALANPGHAPYGRAAREALVALGLWEALDGRRVMGENVAQAAQFAISGPETVGLIAESLLHAPGMSERMQGVAIDPGLYAPIRHRMVLINPDAVAAKRFYAYLSSGVAADIFDAHGFARPPGGS